MPRKRPEVLVIPVTSLRKRSGGSGGLVIVLVCSVLTASLTAVLVSSTGNQTLMPLTGIIPLGLCAWLVLRSWPVKGSLRWQRPLLTLQQGRKTWQGSVTHTELVPWIMPGIGVAQGAILILHTRNEAGVTRVLHIAATEVTAPKSTQPIQQVEPDMWVTPADLRDLIAAHHDQTETSETETSPTERRFALARTPSATQALSQILPWFGTMAVLGVAGVLVGDSAGNSMARQMVTGVLAVVAIVLGIRRTQKASAPKTTWTLVITPQTFQIVDAQGKSIWNAPRPTPITASNYLYRTKYSSHRFSVRQLGPTDNAVRIGVWDPGFTNTTHPDGRAPGYIIGTPDWPALLSAVEGGTRS